MDANLTALTEPTPTPLLPTSNPTNEDLLFNNAALGAALKSANGDKLLIRRYFSTLPTCNWLHALRRVPCDSNNDGLAD